MSAVQAFSWWQDIRKIETKNVRQVQEGTTLTCSDLDQTEAEYRPVQTVITLIMVGSWSDQGRNMVWKFPRCRRR